MHSTLRSREKDARSAKVKGIIPRSLVMLAKLRPRKKGQLSVKEDGGPSQPLENPVERPPRNNAAPSAEASSSAATRRRDLLDNETKLFMLKALDRSTLDTVQGVMPNYRAIVGGDKLDGFCLRDIWVLIIELHPPSGGYRVMAFMPPTDGLPTRLPPTAADLQRASRRAEFTVPLADPLSELTVRLVGLLKNSRIKMWIELRDVFISQQFLDAIRPALQGLSAGTAILSLNRVTCNVGHGHAQLVDMLDGVCSVDMRQMGGFQPNDLDDEFLRRCLANGCRDVVFPEGRAAPLITDESIFELCFVNDPYRRPQRFLFVEEPTLSATFVRDFVRRYLASADDVPIYLSITVTPPPQLFDEVEQYRAIGHDANTFGGFEFHIDKPPVLLIRWWPQSRRMTIQHFS